MNRRLVMVGGSFEDLEHNVVTTELLGFEAVKAGVASIVPGRTWECSLGDDVMLEVTLSILQRCDALLVTPEWRTSSGTRREVAFARDHGIRVLFSLDELRRWLQEPPKDRRFRVART